jgi:hypothetical protein
MLSRSRLPASFRRQTDGASVRGDLPSVLNNDLVRDMADSAELPETPTGTEDTSGLERFISME